MLITNTCIKYNKLKGHQNRPSLSKVSTNELLKNILEVSNCLATPKRIEKQIRLQQIDIPSEHALAKRLIKEYEVTGTTARTSDANAIKS
jgi:hypothetical protein